MKNYLKVKPFLDLLPLLVFFISFRALGLYPATVSLIISTLAVTGIMFIMERRVAITPLLTAAIVALFGGLSLWLHDETFIKIKPTVINALFSAILLGGYFMRKGLIRHVMGAALQLTDNGWRLLSLRFGLFFLAMAALNEWVWRTLPTEWWVNFKVFGLLGLTALFVLAQAGFIQRHQCPEQTAESHQ